MTLHQPDDELIERLKAEAERALEGTAPATEEALRALANAGMPIDMIVANVFRSLDGAMDALREVATPDKVGPRTGIAIVAATWAISRCLQDVYEEHADNCDCGGRGIGNDGSYKVQSVNLTGITDPTEVPGWEDMPDGLKAAIKQMLDAVDEEQRRAEGEDAKD